jgi:hypothetical protein
MPNKILVAYASRTGSTAGVAEAIGQILAESGAPVEVGHMQDVKDLAPYRAVVAGSAIQGGAMAAGGHAIHADSSGSFSPEALRRFFGLYDAGHAKRRQIPPERGGLAGAGMGTGEAGKRGPLCRDARYQQSAIVSR